MTTGLPEFSRTVAAETIGEDGQAMTIEADAGERDRLAERFGLAGLANLKAELTLTPEKGGRLIRLRGTVRANLTQTCVVTLEPLKAEIEGAFERLYDTALNEAAEDGEPIDPGSEDPSEPVPDGVIDVGEAVAEQLALELDPFPRKPGVSLEEYSTGAAEGDKPEGGKKEETKSPGGPFALLKKLKKDLK